MTPQRFKTIVAKSGTRVFVPIPFNPNEVWGIKQRHHITGTVNGYKVRGSLGSDGTQCFLILGAAWRRDCDVDAGTEVDILLSPKGRNLKLYQLILSAHWMMSQKPKPFLNRLLLFIETHISNGLRVPNDLKRGQHGLKK